MFSIPWPFWQSWPPEAVDENTRQGHPKQNQQTHTDFLIRALPALSIINCPLSIAQRPTALGQNPLKRLVISRVPKQFNPAPRAVHHVGRDPSSRYPATSCHRAPDYPISAAASREYALTPFGSPYV